MLMITVAFQMTICVMMIAFLLAYRELVVQVYLIGRLHMYFMKKIHFNFRSMCNVFSFFVNYFFY